MSLTSEEVLAVVVVVLLAAGTAGVLLVMRQRLRRRRAQLIQELSDRPAVIQDRAFNRIAMARREAELVSDRGADVGRARDQIAQAQAAFDSRQFARAYESAQMAHETLVGLRRAAPLPSSSLPANRASASTAPPSPLPLSVSSPGTGNPSAAPAPAPTAPPKNRVESQFQLRLLAQELEVARHDRPDDGKTGAAGALDRQAREAFDRADFTEAFRLALRGRRALGDRVEALPPGPGGGAPAPPPPGNAPGALRSEVDAAGSAESVASAGRCPTCGYPALPGDTFCRGCGTPRAPPTCPKCGAVRQSADTFCGRCGAHFA